ncbi:hypothetical protein B0J11DRAFT_580923 [Dendryphion nanum]|uniref:Uncharacterized protein n=1 Tax=Dendryphion nanum TaxID=256645 RepID=A0A9P9DRR4_9PLEO|nr:hypothetical protein B0J11DRAFT_580923 [Dendryphion nanum]
MHLNSLLLVTSALTISQAAVAAAAEPAYCYKTGGFWGTEDQNVEARRKAQEWCQTYGNAWYGPGIQAKSCVDYSNGKIMFRIKNGLDTVQYLAEDTCWLELFTYILDCNRGGMNDTWAGWRGRADPGTGCD